MFFIIIIYSQKTDDVIVMTSSSIFRTFSHIFAIFYTFSVIKFLIHIKSLPDCMRAEIPSLGHPDCGFYDTTVYPDTWLKLFRTKLFGSKLVGNDYHIHFPISTDFEHVSEYHEARVIPSPFYPDDSYISIRILISQGYIITEKIINRNTIKCIKKSGWNR